MNFEDYLDLHQTRDAYHKEGDFEYVEFYNPQTKEWDDNEAGIYETWRQMFPEEVAINTVDDVIKREIMYLVEHCNLTVSLTITNNDIGVSHTKTYECKDTRDPPEGR